MTSSFCIGRNMQRHDNLRMVILAVQTHGGSDKPPYIGLASNVSPKAQSPMFGKCLSDGVSTSSVPNLTYWKSQMKVIASPNIPDAIPLTDAPHWYVLRSTYGREKTAYDYLSAKGIRAFYPTIQVVKQIREKRKVVTVSRFPNIFFAYATEEQLKTFVYDNVNLPFLRFYYRHSHVDNKIEKSPMIVPDYQMDDLRIICTSDSSNVI